MRANGVNLTSESDVVFRMGYRLVLLPQQGVFERQKGQKLRTPNTRNTFLAAATDAWIFLALPGSPAEMNMQVYCTRRVAFNRETSMWSGYRLIAVKRPISHLYERRELVLAARLCQEAIEGLEFKKQTTRLMWAKAVCRFVHRSD